MEQKPLAWWELGGTRRAVAITFIVGVALLLTTFFSAFDDFYNAHPKVKSFVDAIVILSGLALAVMELKHSGEANKHHHEFNLLTERANDYRKEANRFSKESLELQTRVQILQEDIDRKLTKIRLYVAIRNGYDGIELWASNLFDFDLWITKVDLVVTQTTTATAGSYSVDGGTQISRGHCEKGYRLYGTIQSIHNNRADRIDMRFYVQVEAMGVSDDPMTVRSPEYRLTFGNGKPRELTLAG
jgi:hypothetical protein